MGRLGQKEKISETIGTVGGGTLGFGVVSSVISSSGVVAGLSASGISSGLASIGGIVGGGMVTGVIVSAAIPIAMGALGYAVIAGIKYLINKKKLNNEELDESWEIERT